MSGPSQQRGHGLINSGLASCRTLLVQRPAGLDRRSGRQVEEQHPADEDSLILHMYREIIHYSAEVVLIRNLYQSIRRPATSGAEGVT